MAKHRKNETPADAPDAPADSGNVAAAPAPTFAIRTLSPNYSGIHPFGLHFREGRAMTDDAVLADQFRAAGYTVTSADNGDVMTAAQKAKEQAAATDTPAESEAQ